MIIFRNDEVHPVNFKEYNVLFVFECIGDYSCMTVFITEESLTIGLLNFLRLL